MENTRKFYSAPSVEIVRFAVEDIITNSPTELQPVRDEDE